MKFKLRQMEVFRAVMITGSITSAARMLFVSQPAISRIISHTESSLGLQLFRRTKGKLVPTSEALRLFEQVEGVYEAAQRADEFAESLAGRLSGAITLCVSPCLNRTVIARAVAPFAARYPNVTFHIYSRLLSEMPFDLLSRKADLAVAVQPLTHANLLSQPIGQVRMVCVMPQSHALAAMDEVGLEDVAQHPLVMHNEGLEFGELVRSAFKVEKLSYSSTCKIHHTDSACALVRAGLGVAVLDPFSVAEGAWPDLVIRPIRQEIPLTPSLIRSSFTEETTETERFAEFVTAMRFD